MARGQITVRAARWSATHPWRAIAMWVAVVIACFVMYVSSGPVSKFVADHPTTKMLALAFLLLIGAALIADGFHFHIPRAYLYFAMAFSAAVEAVNVIAMRNRRKSKPAKPVEER